MNLLVIYLQKLNFYIGWPLDMKLTISLRSLYIKYENYSTKTVSWQWESSNIKTCSNKVKSNNRIVVLTT